MNDYLDYLYWQSGIDEPKPSQARTLDKEFSAYTECIVLASMGDDLGALISSRALDEANQDMIARFCQANTEEANKTVSLVLASVPKWELRRKQRNIRRRLLRAVLYRKCNMPLDDTLGMKYNTLKAIAHNKGILT